MGIIDVLPNCVSSVYFMYEKEWEKHSLGKVRSMPLQRCVPSLTWLKLSALREVSLAKEMHDAGLVEMGFLYMGMSPTQASQISLLIYIIRFLHTFLPEDALQRRIRTVLPG